MDRRKFLKVGSASLTSFYMLPTKSFSEESVDHPDVIAVNVQSQNIALALQDAFSTAYQLWLNDPQKRRPVITLPEGNFEIGEIVGNNRGNYPFHMPPTFKLQGAAKNLTFITAAQPQGSQYRFLMVQPNTRLDILANCPTLDKQCVASEVNAVGPSFNIEISNITFVDFDNAIALKDATDCYIHHCDFIGSLVAIQLDMGSQLGNRNHIFEHCKFDATLSTGDRNRFCLRFEAPYSTVWTDIEQGVQDLGSCLALGGENQDYNSVSQTCTVPSDDKLCHYLESFFGENIDEDVANRGCHIKYCDFYYSDYSAIEFAGKLNIKNHVDYCGFYQCNGTGVEFDKGASFNIVSNSLFSGIKPTTTFSPSIPYIFQAAIQEQEGSNSVDARIKSLITEKGYDDPTSLLYLGSDIFLRAASMPQGNQINNNSFDTSRSYSVSDYEINSTKASKLPDIYPSIKLRKSLNTKVIGNIEFTSSTASAVDDTVMGQSVILYQNDGLRDLRGGIEIKDNQFQGAFFIVGLRNGLKDTLPLLIENNDFGMSESSPRGGFSWLYFNSVSTQLINNRVKCARNVNSSVMQKFDITTFTLQNNDIQLPTNNAWYIRSIETNDTRANLTSIINNQVYGGLTIYAYDYSAAVNGPNANDTIIFSGNKLVGMTGANRVIGVTLWSKNLIVNDNDFEWLEDKVFQLYALSETFNHDGLNRLQLGNNSQNRVYSRNYQNTVGLYVTDAFWAS